MRANFPPFTRPEAAYDSRRLYEETSAIAAAQDAKRAMTDAERDTKLRTVAFHIFHAKRLMDEVFAESKAHSRELLAALAREAQTMGLYEDADTPDKTANDDDPGIDWNACFPTRAQLDAAATGKPPLEPSRICTPAELAYLASFGPNNTAAPRDDAPPMFATLRDIPDGFTDSRGNRVTRRDVTRHPAHAEALRDHDERLFGGEDRL